MLLDVSIARRVGLLQGQGARIRLCRSPIYWAIIIDPAHQKSLTLRRQNNTDGSPGFMGHRFNGGFKHALGLCITMH